MASQPEIILPEVHLDSPIVKHKLLYLLRLGAFPTLQAFENDGPLAGQNWARIRNEESNLYSRLKTQKFELERRLGIVSTQINQRRHCVLLWPRIIPKLSHIKISEYLEKTKEWKHLIEASIQNASNQLITCTQQISSKLTGRKDLFVRSRVNDSGTLDQYPSPIQLAQAWHANIWHRQVEAWLLIKHRMRQLISELRQMPAMCEITILDTRSCIILIGPELVVLYLREERVISYFTFEMVLMVSDVMEGRLNVTALASISHYLSPLLPRISKLLDLVDQLALIIGDYVFDVIVSLESFCYAQLQLLDPVDELKGDFYAFMCNEILETLESTNAFSQDESMLLTMQLTSCYSKLTPDLTAELLCIMRLWGHPSLTATQAADKVRESMCAAKVIKLETVLKTRAFFHTILINGYRRRHNGIWPPHKLPESAPLSLIELAHDNNEITYQYALKNWKAITYIQFYKCFDSDPGEDLSIFMKDKAISCPKDDWMSVFRRSLIKERFVAARKELPNQVNRRLLLNFLDDPNFNPEEELKYVTTGEYLTDDQFCASYSLKEKEIKTTGRIFAKLTRRMRSCQVIAESMLANHAGKLMKENGVVHDQLKLTKSLLTMNQIGIISHSQRRFTKDNQTVLSPFKSKSKHPNDADPMSTTTNSHEIAACFLTTDLKKYCLQWRYQTIIPFAQTLNAMYGYPHLFEWIHLRLMRSTLYVGDPFNPPDSDNPLDLDEVLNGDIFIVSPRGGIEGLCQKLWTMISISTIILSATEANTRVMSMVQGDNQVIAVTTKVPRSIPHKEKKAIALRACQGFFERLRENNYGIGHHLKAQETILSSDFFIYSKRVFFRGRILTQALKNASKLCLTADILGDCTQSSCSNLATTVMRLAENGIEKDLCIYLNYYLTVRQLTFDLTFPQYANPNTSVNTLYTNHPTWISRLALLPSQLGGLNYLSCSRLFNRNIGDPLVSAIADLKRLIISQCIEPWILGNLLGRRPGKGTWSTIAADPYALNIDYLYPPTTFLKRHTQSVLMEGSQNPLLAGIFSENAQSEENELAQFLLDREIVMPRVAHVVIAQTSCGRRKQIQGYLDSTRTIIRHALKIQPLSTKRVITIVEYNSLYLAYVLEIIETPREVPPYLLSLSVQDCSIDIARTLRKLSWASLLGGRPIEGLETPDPIELLDGHLLLGDSVCYSCEAGDEKYSWFYLPSGVYLDRDPAENPPIRVPYIGSRTDERRVASMTYIKGASSPLKAALRLAGVYIWAFGESDDSWAEAYQLASSRVDISLDDLQTLTPLPTSANITHRLDDGTTQLKFTPASSYAFSSFVHISNDSQQLEIDERVTDSNLIYQQVMITGLGIIEAWNNPPINCNLTELTLHLHTGSSCCIRPVDSCFLNPPWVAVPELNVPVENSFVFDSHPIDIHESLRLSDLKYASKINSIDYMPLNLQIPLLAHLTGRAMVNSIIGLDESTSIMNDAIIESDYTSNWISECLHTYIDQVFVFAAWNLLLELSYQMYYLRVRGWDNILDYVYVTLRRIPGMALSGMCATISHPRILRRLIDMQIVVPGNSPYLATLDFTKLCVDALIWGCKQALTNIKEGFDLEIVVPSEISFILSDRILNLVARKLSLLAVTLSESTMPPRVKGMSPEDKCAAITKYLHEFALPLLVEDDRRLRLEKIIDEPQITAYPNNLYYLARKILNNIRSSDEGQFLLEMYYEPFSSQLEIPRSATPETDNPDLRSTLTVNDFYISIVDSATQLEKHDAIDWIDDPSSGKSKFSRPPSHHVLRPLGLSSTSWYKSISIVEYLSRLSLSLGSHLYLAEGSGASMAYIEYYIPAPTIFYNSFFSSSDNPPQRNFEPLPTQFVESVVYKQILAEVITPLGFPQEFRVLWDGHTDHTDLTKSACAQFIISKVGPETCSLVHADWEDNNQAETTRLSNALIHITLISSIVLKPGGYLVLKTRWLPFQPFSHLVALLWSYFSDIVALRSAYSDPNSTEVILCCKLGVDCKSVSFNHALSASGSLTSQKFTIIPPECVKEFFSQLYTQSSRVQDAIDRAIVQCTLAHTHSDTMHLINVGGVPPNSKWNDSSVYQSFSDLIMSIIKIITIHLKEIIEILKTDSSDHESLLLTAYNVGILGRINTVIQLMTERILVKVVSSWGLFSDHTRSQLRRDLEMGCFSVSTILSSEEFLRKTDNRKYLSKELTTSLIHDVINNRASIQFSRSQQKQIWKAIGCSALVDQPQEFIDQNAVDRYSEDEERDIHGDEI
ncbi:RNA polymerase [Orthorubulavirus mapueraense]|uniref:RNA-directed RNA polymerase L n=1 Tax=Orthorubulavirus mapueraense TaxID=3052559 RepID=A5H728_9MONO|nr:RNA polymerase [Orthorubulavirus mapueraense]ABQ23938.1 RNA polymerase [Orthorubulavirus mapueraense]